ncbi:MAG: hypothetical protein ACD_63C00076G0001 [uncultured bacterium]|nr:MAG: hypothetical protein ACD_63C00076G0001 [uncultured bacterium]
MEKKTRANFDIFDFGLFIESLLIILVLIYFLVITISPL